MDFQGAKHISCTLENMPWVVDPKQLDTTYDRYIVFNALSSLQATNILLIQIDFISQKFILKRYAVPHDMKAIHWVNLFVMNAIIEIHAYFREEAGL